MYHVDIVQLDVSGNSSTIKLKHKLHPLSLLHCIQMTELFCFDMSEFCNLVLLPSYYNCYNLCRYLIRVMFWYWWTQYVGWCFRVVGCTYLLFPQNIVGMLSACWHDTSSLIFISMVYLLHGLLHWPSWWQHKDHYTEPVKVDRELVKVLYNTLSPTLNCWSFAFLSCLIFIVFNWFNFSNQYSRHHAISF